MSKSDEPLSHNLYHDCGAIMVDNTQLNRILAAKLMAYGYDIYRKGKGLYIIDAGDKGSLKKDLLKLGIQFKQSSLFYPKGSAQKFEDVGDKLHYPSTGFGVWSMLKLAMTDPQDLKI